VLSGTDCALYPIEEIVRTMTRGDRAIPSNFMNDSAVARDD
jgi:hypothetical protein